MLQVTSWAKRESHRRRFGENNCICAGAMFVGANNDLVLPCERRDLTQIMRLQERQIDWQDQKRARRVRAIPWCPGLRRD